MRPDVLTKSGFMVGLGETPDEVRTLLRDLRAAGTDVATIGQYLQPTRRNLPVAEYVEPRQFDEYREYGLALGFKTVFSGPLVRSSYMADLVSEEAAGTAGVVLNWLLALASAALLILTFPRFSICLVCAGGADPAAGGGGARAALAAPLPAGLERGRGLLVRRLLLDSVRALLSRRRWATRRAGRCSCCSAWPRRSTWACSARWPAC